ncbi:MAG TPA: MnhB domain-containing protein [Pseudobdellovibrionaceae bacterium]|nr:MnhB domain-containing protein [Pseudobdellovibrionaceae bacterium]
MNSLLLRTAARVILFLEMAFALIFLFRGHNQPGGGFIGGLIAAGALSVYALAFQAAAVRKMLRLHPVAYMGCGLLLSAGSGFFAVLFRRPYMTAWWWEGWIGTPLIFDIGVFLVVLGMTMSVILTLIEREKENSPSARFRGERED